MVDAEADPAEQRGKAVIDGEVSETAPSDFAGVMTMACMKEEDSATREALWRGRAHGQLALREEPSRALQGGGWARNTDEAG
jgi:hypothetical protein